MTTQLPLLRAAIVASVLCYVAYLLLPLSLYPTLAAAGRSSAMLMVTLVTVSVPISLASVGPWMEFLALMDGRDAFASWSPEQVQAAIAGADLRRGADGGGRGS